MRPVLRTLVVLTTLVVILPTPARAASAPDAGRAFEVKASSAAIYDIRQPSDNPDVQRHVVNAQDGVALFVETWLPKRKPGGPPPPPTLPTIVNMTPYARQGSGPATAIGWLVRRGYAFSVMHVRGTGSSEGCVRLIDRLEVDDSARVIRYLGSQAPWTNGIVGAFGISYHGGTAILAAADGQREYTRYLKALVVGAPYASAYQFTHLDGVGLYVRDELLAQGMFDYGVFPEFATADLIATGDADAFVTARTSEGGTSRPDILVQRPACFIDNAIAGSDDSGDFTPYWREREHRFRADRMTAATLMVHGHADDVVLPYVQRGLFDRIRAPKAGIFGVFGHEFPSDHGSGVRREWERADFWPMVVNWFDRWLKSKNNRADAWPRAQIQGTDGQWRAEPNWPATGGAAAWLALGNGTLGTREPRGSTIYAEGLPFADSSPVQEGGDRAVFTTSPMKARLEVTGQPTLDLWVTLDRPDAHIAASLEVIDGADERIPAAYSFGARSMRHLAGFDDGLFVQREGEDPPVGVPFRTTIRLNPTDLVVEKGHRLRLVIADSRTATTGVPLFEDPTMTSNSSSTVMVHHDCAHPSFLRFEIPDERPQLLDVREKDQPSGERLGRQAAPPFVSSDGGGIATTRIDCG